MIRKEKKKEKEKDDHRTMENCLCECTSFGRETISQTPERSIRIYSQLVSHESISNPLCTSSVGEDRCVTLHLVQDGERKKY
jgi:hypothetical protein